MAEPEVIEARKDYLAPLEEHEDGISEGISVINTAEINQQIATAHRFPRSVTAFRRKVYEMVTLDVETAESCIYAIPRDGKMIDGPSIRFAEILLVGWGNYRAATEVTDIGDRFITAEGMFMDLEINGAIKAKTMRRIVGKASDKHPNGKRFGDDMIATTGNAASSIALRNAITRGIPKALWKELFDEAKKVAGGSAQTFGARRDKVIKELGIQGATPDQIFALLGIKGADDMQTEHLVHLRGLQNAIKDGEITVDEAFKPGLKLGEVAPPQPQRSDFERPAQEDASTVSSEQAKAAAVQQQSAQEAKPAAAEPAAAKVTAVDAFGDWYKDQKVELAACKKVREVADLREAVTPQLDGYPELEKEFAGLCDAKTKDILQASRKVK